MCCGQRWQNFSLSIALGFRNPVAVITFLRRSHGVSHKVFTSGYVSWLYATCRPRAFPHASFITAGSSGSHYQVFPHRALQLLLHVVCCRREDNDPHTHISSFNQETWHYCRPAVFHLLDCHPLGWGLENLTSQSARLERLLLATENSYSHQIPRGGANPLVQFCLTCIPHHPLVSH